MRFTRAAGLAGILAPAIWLAVWLLELIHANVGRSIISRPERFFSDSAWHWPLVALVLALVAAEMAVARRLRQKGPPPWNWPEAHLVAALLIFAAICRLAMALPLPSDPNGYTVSSGAALMANAVVIVLPLAVLSAAYMFRQQSAGLAWLSAGMAIAMASIAVWATTWASRSGASQPQLLAVEPIEALTAAWCAAVGAWLLGWPAGLSSAAAWPVAPTPGRKSAAVVAFFLAIGILGQAGSFAYDFGPTIVSQLTGRVQVESIHADAVDRTYRVYRPANESASPGLVIVLHGSFGGGFQAETTTGFDAQADRLGWIAVYPDGVADGWDTFGSGSTWGNHPGADDMHFIENLIHHFEVTDLVDPDRVYVTGHSRGGMMSYRLGCEMSDLIAAIAPVSGNMATATGSVDVPCPLAGPVSVLATHGTADGTIPMAGGRIDIVFSPMADVIARWRSLDGCAGSPAVRVEGAVTTTVWGCAAGSTVSTRIIDGGCHCWASDDSRAIADFFVAHPRVPRTGPSQLAARLPS